MFSSAAALVLAWLRRPLRPGVPLTAVGLNVAMGLLRHVAASVLVRLIVVLNAVAAGQETILQDEQTLTGACNAMHRQSFALATYGGARWIWREAATKEVLAAGIEENALVQMLSVA